METSVFDISGGRGSHIILLSLLQNDMAAPADYTSAFGLNISDAIYPSSSEALIPMAEAVKPPLKIPIKPSFVMASFTPEPE